MLSLFKYELFSRWGAVLGWGIGLATLGVMYIAIYPEFEDKMSVLADISFYKALGIDMGSFEGLIASSVILNLAVILAIYVIITSSGTLAGEEDRGTLELIVTMPLRRWQIVTTKAAALVGVTFLILLIAGISNIIALAWLKSFMELDVTAMQYFMGVLSAWPITLAFLMIGLFFSASMPNRRIAAMATTAVFLVCYFGAILTGLVESLKGLQPFLLFHYFDTSAALFTKGAQPGDVATLLGIAAFFFILTLISFQRRDITVGQWPWQRAKRQR